MVALAPAAIPCVSRTDRPGRSDAGRDGWVVITHRRKRVALPDARVQPVFLHHATDPFAAHLLVLLEKIFVDAGGRRRAVRSPSNDARTNTFSRRSSGACVDSGRCARR